MPEEQGESLIGRVIMPRDMVTYQEGTVVSKMVMMSREGTVTLFAFDKDHGLSEHTAPFDALAFALDGEAEITIAGVPHHIREGEMIIMPATIPHAVSPISRFKMMLIMIHAKKKGEETGPEEKDTKKAEKKAKKKAKKADKKKKR
ncbi:cupin domain-containing protein [Methanocalculus sp.]|uniref:cupin domain-containing protein n=1 Tax=Methanocalculus sp. TaxID=2004547 RepID=UPI00351D2CF2